MRNEKQIVSYLSEVVEVLRRLKVNQQYHVLIPGGAYMLIRRKRSFTEDIDFALIDPRTVSSSRRPFKVTIIHDEISRSRSGIPFAREFRQAILEVAQCHPELAEDWLNDESAQYLYEDAPHPDVQFWRSFDHLLFAYLPTPQYVFATKLMANRQKDINDIAFLMQELKIRKRAQAQAIVAQFLSPDAQAFYEVEDKLDDLFPFSS